MFDIPTSMVRVRTPLQFFQTRHHVTQTTHSYNQCSYYAYETIIICSHLSNKQITTSLVATLINRPCCCPFSRIFQQSFSSKVLVVGLGLRLLTVTLCGLWSVQVLNEELAQLFTALICIITTVSVSRREPITKPGRYLMPIV
jgi:hypothetical protein